MLWLFGIFSPVLVFYVNKNLATLVRCSLPTQILLPASVTRFGRKLADTEENKYLRLM
jgi:hypothetical protein